MKKKALIIFLLVVLGAAAYWIWNKKYSSNSLTVIEKKGQSLDSAGENNSVSTSEEKNLSGENSSSTIAPQINVTTQDCDDECSKFQKDDELEYCQQICGISDLYEQDYENPNATEEESSVDCDKVSGIQKDYCLKDKAIEEEDFRICEEIKDTNIKKTCKNRLTEDWLDSQNSSELAD